MIINPTGYKVNMPIPYPDEFPGMVSMVVASLLSSGGCGFGDSELITRNAIDTVVHMQNAVYERLNGEKFV